MGEQDITLGPETLVAVEAAERALGVVRGRVGASDVTSKGGRDIVTATDVAVEDLVRGVLGESSDRPVIGEERGGEAPTDGSAYWLVDPICGTRNFASGIPLYCVNLALVEGDEIVAAVVADPSTGEIDVAERGRGAWAMADPARRLRASADSHIVSFGEDHRADGGRRARSARFIADADHGRSVRAPGVELHRVPAVRGVRPGRGVCAVRRHGAPHGRGKPARRRGRRSRVRHRRRAVDDPLHIDRGRRHAGTPPRPDLAGD